jgi:thiol:disulfide interchange protein DsbC
MPHFLLFSFLLGLCFNASAQMTPEQALQSIRATYELPIDKFIAVEDVKGDMFFVSKNGRYAIKGTMIDVWSQEPLTTIAHISESVDRLTLPSFSNDIDGFKPVVLGEGREVVTVFTDPSCQSCAKLMNQIVGLKDRYTFKILHVPVLGDQSKELTKRLYCADDEAARIATETLDYGDLDQEPSCDMEAYEKRLLAADIVQVRHVPFLVAPDRRIMRGNPKDLNAWLNSSSKEL